MSFAYKQISPSNINISNEEFNKNYKYDTLLDDNISLFVGENIPTSYIDPIQLDEYGLTRLSQFNFFDSNNDDKTQNDEYRRLIFSSIKHLFYGGSLNNGQINNNSSSFVYYPQTEIYSGSYTTTFRNLGNFTGSSLYSIATGYNTYVVYDNIYLYNQTLFDNYRGSLVYVISFNKNIYGNGLKENSIIYNYSGSYIRDDGKGNIFDFGTEETYNNYLDNNIVTGSLIGNVIYNMGLLIITNNDYLCIFDIPPVAVNDSYIYDNRNIPTYLDVYNNDYSDCNNINFSLTELVSQSDYTFPNCYIDEDYLYLIEDQNLYIPGNYRIGYKIYNNDGIESNVGIVYLNITAKPLSLDITNDQICSGSEILPNFDVNILGGVPKFEYSFNGIDYTSLNDFNIFNITGSINPETSSIYVRDYEGTVVSGSFNWFYEYDYDINITSSSFCNNSGSILISTSHSLDFDIENYSTGNLPNISYDIPIGNHTIYINTSEGCVITESINIPIYDIITSQLSSSSINCSGNETGILNISNIVGGLPPYSISFYSSSYSGITTESVSINNLPVGNYELLIRDSLDCIISESINITSNLSLSMSISDVFDNECYPALSISGSGGTPPYIYTIISPNNVYVSSDEVIFMSSDNNNELYVTCSIEDLNGCTKTQYHYIPSRVWEYSGSYCEQI